MVSQKDLSVTSLGPRSAINILSLRVLSSRLWKMKGRKEEREGRDEGGKNKEEGKGGKRERDKINVSQILKATTAHSSTVS